jgi:hypothetical protein
MAGARRAHSHARDAAVSPGAGSADDATYRARVEELIDIEGAPTAATRPGHAFVTLYCANYHAGYDDARNSVPRPHGDFVELTSVGR